MTSPLSASFDPKLKIYLVLQVAAVLCVTMVGLVVLPAWAVLGPIWAHFYSIARRDAAASRGRSAAETEIELLKEIRDALVRIEARLVTPQ